MNLVVLSSAIGVLIGVIFALLYINFDATWKKIGSFLIGTGGSGGLIVLCFSSLEIENSEDKRLFVACLVIAILLAFVLTLSIAAFLIKDKDDANIIRIRDVLLGQKSYIDGYYDNRKKQIDEKLNIEELERREESVTKRENICSSREKAIAEEHEKIAQLGKDKLKITIPDNKQIILTQRFIKIMPSFASDYRSACSRIQTATEKLLNETTISMTELMAYFFEISTYIMDYLFADKEVRVHFRQYNFESRKYENICAFAGKEKKLEKSLTPIPYESLIRKSHTCGRGVLKSLNPEADYRGTHFTKWVDYLTITFGNIIIKDTPILSMGISTQNEERSKDMFYYLEFMGFDLFLIDKFEEINNKFGIEKIIYAA